MSMAPSRFQSNQNLPGATGFYSSTPKTPAYGSTTSNGEIFSVRTHLNDLEVSETDIKNDIE